MRITLLAAAAIAATLLPVAAFAAPTPTQLATVYVVCDHRQGSGTYVGAADGGYVLMVGHVPIDPVNRTRAEHCTVGFPIDDELRATAFYGAEVVHAVYEERADRDLALLRLTGRTGPNEQVPFTLPQPVPVNAFAQIGDPLTVHGYPGGSPLQKNASGMIQAFGRGTMNGNAPISPGYSGGPAVNSLGHLVGIAERVRYEVDEETGEQRVTEYQYSDILTMINWLDEFEAGLHDRVLVHSDANRYHSMPYVSRDEGSGCAYVVRTRESPTVYCLLSSAQRLVFPNEATFRTWYPDNAEVQFITTENLSDYRLIGNMTMKAHSLIKIQTDPRVYVVTDSLGTMRAIPSEARAIELFGADWAKKVRDVPDGFFVDYHPAVPLQ